MRLMEVWINFKKNYLIFWIFWR